MQLNKFLGTALMAATLATGSALMPSAPAEAGTNGQQLRINSGWYTSVKDEGFNQGNTYSYWGPVRSSGTVYTNGMWWKGFNKVTVSGRPSWAFWMPPTRVCTYTIPTVQLFSDWYTVTCN